MKFFLFVTGCSSVVGALWLLGGLFLAKSAPQEASAAAIACAFAILPYVFARAGQLWERADDEKRRHSELLQAIAALQKPAADGKETEPRLARVAQASSFSLTRGRCPNCQALNSLSASRCSSCGTSVDDWRPEPIA